MALAKGVAKVVAIAPESAFGVAPAAGAARLLRRVTANFNLTKENYQSSEIRQSYQLSDGRHGTRMATGTLDAELSAGSYFDLQEALLARDYTVVTAMTGLSITIATAGSNYTVTRSAGSWITGGVSPGMVVRLTAGTFNVANSNKNVLVMSVTASALTVRVLNGSTMVAEGPIASATLSVMGKTTYVPLTGHTDKSFSVEERYADIAQYERFVGMKVNNMSVSIPSNGLATVNFGMAGKDMDRAQGTAYFTAPTAQGSTGIFSGANGALLVNGVAVAIVTSADFSIDRVTENAAVVGSNSLADIFTGRITSTGNLSLYFQDGATRDLFDAETEFSLVFALTSNNTATADVMTFTFPRVKLNGFEKADGELGIVVSSPFEAFENAVTSGGLYATTVMIQDTTLV